ncbi:hypothetical protein QBC36DRAFT_363242 [Triangularia setosa]|uniref:Uncharacterized protein n=1 Tax=Triangularia setosa TaxID=2587417 RepID=A0AAN7A4N3_9PEZI|nr:hypothetical protein QBC36DRAFT_363242 [Podospora setosa]
MVMIRSVGKKAPNKTSSLPGPDCGMLINPFTNEATVAKEKKMADGDAQAFQIGTDLVHSCTVVTIVSNRAMWMAHFWEVSGMGVFDWPVLSSAPWSTKTSVINPITREVPIIGDVEPLTHNLYTQPTDQTRVSIYTPLRPDWASVPGRGLGANTWLHKNRINEIIAAIEQAIGTGPMIEVIPYYRLNYRATLDVVGGIPKYYYSGPDTHLVGNTARGSVLFHKDDNADDEDDAELSNLDDWQLGPAPSVSRDINRQRLCGSQTTPTLLDAPMPTKHLWMLVATQQEGNNPLIGRQLDALEKIMRTEGLAPNLREVRLKHARSHNVSYLQPHPYPSGWLPEEVGARPRKQQSVALKHLELGYHHEFHQITGIQLQHWTELADLSGLQTLELTVHVAECGLDTILSLHFPFLTTLTFRCMRNPIMGYFDKVKCFLAGLSPTFVFRDARYRPNLSLFLSALSREYIINTVNPKREGRIQKTRRGGDDWKSRQEMWRISSNYRRPLNAPYFKHFERLWLDVDAGSRDWYGQWQSWPLAGATLE